MRCRQLSVAFTGLWSNSLCVLLASSVSFFAATASAQTSTTERSWELVGGAGERVSGAAGNMAALFDGAWKDVGLFGLGFISKIVMGGLMWFVLGAIVGFVLFWLLKRLKITRIEASWYRYIGWIWAPLCIVSLALGAGWGGMWKGGEKAVEKAVVQDGVVRKVIANVYAAVAMDGSAYEASGKETAEDVAKLFEDSPQLMHNAQKQLGAKIEGMYEAQIKEQKMSMWQKFLVRAVAQSGFEDKILGDYGDDAKVLFSTLYLYTKDRSAYDAALAENPGLAPMGLAIGNAVSHAEKESTRWVRATSTFNWITGWIIGAGIPLGAALLFKLLCFVAGRAKNKVVDVVEDLADGESSESRVL